MCKNETKKKKKQKIRVCLLKSRVLELTALNTSVPAGRRLTCQQSVVNNVKEVRLLLEPGVSLGAQSLSSACRDACPQHASHFVSVPCGCEVGDGDGDRVQDCVDSVIDPPPPSLASTLLSVELFARSSLGGTLQSAVSVARVDLASDVQVQPFINQQFEPLLPLTVQVESDFEPDTLHCNMASVQLGKAWQELRRLKGLA